MSDPYSQAKESTKRIVRLNEQRLYWVRIEWAANALVREFYGKDNTEKAVVSLLQRASAAARLRIENLDEVLAIEAQNHEQIMIQILELP